jgi:hypothetical protein
METREITIRVDAAKAYATVSSEERTAPSVPLEQVMREIPKRRKSAV